MTRAPTDDLTDMTFVITGGAQGIGACTAKLAASRGAQVVVADVDDQSGMAVASEIAVAGGDAVYVHCDVTSPREIQALMGAAAEIFGGIDVLHNNAGVHETNLTRALSVDAMPEEVWDRVMAINLRAPWLCSKYALPYLRESEFASIVNAGSTSSWVGFPGNLAYGPSKAGIAGLTRNLAVDLAADGIRVNCYCPATIRTPMVSRYIEGSDEPDATLSALLETQLIPRIGEPEDVASVVCFLASHEASFITGAVWLVDGGALAWRGTADVLGLASDPGTGAG